MISEPLRLLLKFCRLTGSRFPQDHHEAVGMDISPFNLQPKYLIGKAFIDRVFDVFGVVKLNESPIERDICHGFRPVFLGGSVTGSNAAARPIR